MNLTYEIFNPVTGRVLHRNITSKVRLRSLLAYYDRRSIPVDYDQFV